MEMVPLMLISEKVFMVKYILFSAVLFVFYSVNGNTVSIKQPLPMGFFNVFSKKTVQQTAPVDQNLNWPDTSNWVRIDASIMKEGLTILLPPSMKYYLYEAGITLWTNEHVTHSIETTGSYNSFDMKENRDWINDPDNRSNVKWLIDDPHFAYFTGTDLSASTKNKTTHSCFGEKWVDGQRFFMNVDGITIDDAYSHNLTQEECLTYVLIFRSIR